MAKLTYLTLMSLDGYTADEHGKFDWSAPDAEVHAFVNDLERPTGTYLFGRRMYEVMAAWEDLDAFADEPPVIQDFARIWQATDKVVYSRTLEAVSTARTRLVRDFDPDEVRQMKESAASDLGIGGAELAAHAFRAGLIDECRLFLTPIIVGGGTRALPDNARVGLELRDERRFDSGVVFLRYDTAG